MSIYRYSLIGVSLLGSNLASSSSALQVSPAAVRPASTQALADVQQRIDAARLAAVTTDNITNLQDIAARLRDTSTGLTGQASYYVPYWLAYTDYLIANRQLKAGRRSEAAEALAEADALLNGTSRPDVETYALLSLVAGLRIAVTTPEKIGDVIGQARDALERAIALDPSNVRVLYARALADFTTPKQYGGGRVSERFARNAIDRPPESMRGLKPGWGHDDSAALLIKILRADGRDGEANTILTRFIARYPSSASLYHVSGKAKP